MEKAKVLKTIPMFSGLTDEEALIIAASMKEVECLGETILFEENTPGSSLYIIKTGEIEILKRIIEGKSKIVVVLKSGDFFGEMSLIDNSPRSAGARVAKDSIIYELRKKDFENILDGNRDLALKVMRGIVSTLCQRLRSTTDQIKDRVMWGFTFKK